MFWKKLSRIPDTYRTAGAFGVAGRVAALPPLSLVCYAAGTVVLKASKLRLPAPFERLTRSFTVQHAAPSDLPAVIASGPAEDRDERHRVFGKYLDSGATGVLIRRKDRIVGYNWVFAGRYDLEVGSPRRKVTLLLEQGDVFFGAGYVSPEYRMQGVFPLMIHASSQARGPAATLWSASHIWNDLSLRSHQRLGFERQFEVRCIDVLGSEHYLHNRGAEHRWQRLHGSAMELAPA